MDVFRRTEFEYGWIGVAFCAVWIVAAKEVMSPGGFYVTLAALVAITVQHFWLAYRPVR